MNLFRFDLGRRDRCLPFGFRERLLWARRGSLNEPCQRMSFLFDYAFPSEPSSQHLTSNADL